ncbi:unnamed protein product [Linum tenue]|uniref:Senescence regulator n=2 Tax=Linum tenue TaxID=586396 RepID=A0AAV0JBH2_9ROSI|nr:unnamed protein product [Linum tenue]
MAKGNRRLTTSRSERLLGAYGGGGYSNGHHAEPELREEDVWSTLHGSDDGTRFDRENVSLSEWSSRAGSESNEMAGAGESPRRQVASSAPVNVPDWSKILRIDSVESLHEMSDHDDDDSDGMVPPHEYLAREYARGRKSGGASVFEGVGRTLKGRDLRRVRDAVWSQTGFDG